MTDRISIRNEDVIEDWDFCTCGHYNSEHSEKLDKCFPAGGEDCPCNGFVKDKHNN